MRKLIVYARVTAAAFEMALRQTLRDSFVLFAVIIQPIIIALLALWMLRERGGDYAIFVVVGSGLTGLWSGVLTVSGHNVTGERWTGTLELLVGLPTPMAVIVFGKNLANVVLSFASMLVGYAFVSIVIGRPLPIADPLGFTISVLLTLTSLVALGLILAPLFLVNPEVRSWQNAVEFPVYMLGGFLFPIALLPGWTTPLSYALAPYWASQALHATSSGESAETVLVSWGMMLVLTALYVVIAARLFSVMLRRVREEATLNVQ